MTLASMEVFEFGDLSAILGVTGETRYRKVSYPVRYGIYDEIRTGPYIFQFNLNGEIRHIQCRKSFAMEPTEWLKRTPGNDWVFYASGGYNGAFAAVGEYYVPCFRYRSNGILGGSPFSSGVLEQARKALDHTLRGLESLPSGPAGQGFDDFRNRALASTEKALAARAAQFHRLAGGRISVLPPDTRHVDYDVIPLDISSGCLYNCAFCTVKSGRPFTVHSKEQIETRIQNLKQFYGPDLVNYNALFLGQHDALNAGEETIVWAARKAFDTFGFGRSLMKEPRLFLFGSVGSFLGAGESLFRTLNNLPFTTYMNIGLESADEKTLDLIGKPVTIRGIHEAFSRMEAVNRTYGNLEVTANFLYGDRLPETHMPACLGLIQKQYEKPYTRGAVYFSPYGKARSRKSLVTGFKIIKNQCRLPVYLYIIQRL